MTSKKTPVRSVFGFLPEPLRNKYILTLIAFIFWMVFMDKHNVSTQVELSRTCEKLEEEREFYLSQIDIVKEQKNELKANPEKIAREKYFMKKKDEVIFVFE